MNKAANRNILWAHVFVDEIVKAGLGAVVIAPGSRSTPLVMAFADQDQIPVYSLVDERGAAFFALGQALASAKPTALVCTSGTALANFFPAVIEANQSNVPLIVLSADRPPELSASGANQSIDQIKFYGGYVRMFTDVALPEADPSPKLTRYLRTLADRAVNTAVGMSPGPVHLNFPFRKPLEPTPVDSDITEDTLEDPTGFIAGRAGVFTNITRGVVSPTPEQISLIAQIVGEGHKGLIVCGPRCPGGDFPQAVLQLAEKTGYPILADALSGLRFHSNINKQVFGGYETFLRHDFVDLPEVILQFGAAPTSKTLNQYLGNLMDTQRVLVNEYGQWQDEHHLLTDLVWADPTLFCQQLTAQLNTSPDLAWLSAWQNAEARTWQVIEDVRASEDFEGAIVAQVVENLPDGSDLFIASSNPVRHLDQFAQPRPVDLRIFANRGASGIDGTIASALGTASRSSRPLTLIIGDLAFYHDLNSLLAIKKYAIDIKIVLINNDGGGVFHRLPIAEYDPPFTELFLTPHGLDYAPAAEMFGLTYQKIEDLSKFEQAYTQASGPTLIEVITDSAHQERVRKAIIQKLTPQASPQAA